MPQNARINQRADQIGREIFELATGARPRVYQKAWWLERMTRWVDRDDRLRTRVFQFVDCLPSLGDREQITRHLREYLEPAWMGMPKALRAALRPGRLSALREDLVGWVARSGAVQMAGRFITGYDVPSAIQTLERLRSESMAFTLDVLGESTTSHAQADRYADQYRDLLERLTPVAAGWPKIAVIDEDAAGPMPRVNLSIKLTGLDPHFDPIDPRRAIDEACRRLRPLLRAARRLGAFVNIDMESSKHRGLTLELFHQLFMEDEFRDWPDVGIVLQAYLKESEADLAALLEWGRRRGQRFAIRLVKGAYWDAETAAAVRNHAAPPVWTSKWQSDACYERMTRRLLEYTAVIRPAFASHNVRSLAVVLATAEALGRTRREYEVQMLFGMGDELKTAMVGMGQCVRVYCPYGQLMPGMAYLIRRLLENTSNDGFLKQGFSVRSGYDRALSDPDVARRPSAPLAAREYQNTDPEEEMSAFANAATTNFASAENRRRMSDSITAVRGRLGAAYPLRIGGALASTEEWCESINPSDRREMIGRVACATIADVDRGVAAARRAFQLWRATTAAKRAALLGRVAERLESRRFELAATMILEVGKPWREADAEVSEAIDHCRFYADQIQRIESRPRLRNIPGESNMLAYRAKGVCAVVSPWPFPLAILTGMAGAALAAGNTVVIKPARQAAVTAAKLVETVEEAGAEAGVVNFVPGPGEAIGRYLVEHDDVNVVAFTGSSVVGGEVIRAGAQVRPTQRFIKKMIVEMGGKNAIIVDDDADLDGAVQAVIESAFAYAGQKCSSCSRLIVLDGVYDAFTSRLREATASLVIGPAESPSTIMGPVIDEDAKVRIEQSILLARRDARVLIEVKVPPECGDGFYIAPTIFVDVPPNSPLAQEELLGPVVAVIRARDFDESLAIANDCRYALTGGLFSRSPSHIEQARRDFAVGNLYINRKITGSQVDAQPFGGFKLSGTGVKAGSPDYLLHFMDARCITENTLRSGLVASETHLPAG